MMDPSAWVTLPAWKLERIAERRAAVDIARASLGAPATVHEAPCGHDHCLRVVSEIDANYLPYSLN